MKKKLITSLLMASMIFTMVPSPIYASEVGVVGSTDEQEESNETFENEDDITYAEQTPAMSPDEFFSSLNENETEAPVTESATEETEIDTSGKGYLSIKLTVSDDFYENVQLELYNRDTMEIVKVPVYASNNWTEHAEIPAGRYMVSNVLVGGDDIANPQWIFEMGTKVNVGTDEDVALTVKLLKGPNFTADSTEETVSTDEVTDTNNQNDNTVEQERKSVGQLIKEFVLRLVTGPNFFLLATLVGSSLAIWIIKKKREDN